MGKGIMEEEWETFKLELEEGQELKLDELVDDPWTSLIEQLQKAEHEAWLKGIEANMIILNENLAYVKEFYLHSFSYTISVPPMIMGKEIVLAPLPKEYKYALLHSDKNSKNEKNTQDLLKKYVKVVNGQLIFKGLSYKKNSDDFEAIKEKLGL